MSGADFDTEQFQLNRTGVVMVPDSGQPAEAWGVLNPGLARDRSGQALLFPRLVAEGNFSRIGMAEVQFDEQGNPSGVERQGFALEPCQPYEIAQRGVGGGVEDPRITYVRALNMYVMVYTAFGSRGPRLALALSRDCRTWERWGLLKFGRAAAHFGAYGNKDGVLFPEPVVGPEGRECLVVLHRPTYLIHSSDGTVERLLPPGVTDERPSIWISYIDLEPVLRVPGEMIHLHGTRILGTPETEWEFLKIGAGPPPILTEDGWVLYYHGVSGLEPVSDMSHKDVCYRVGVMVLDRSDPSKILYRSKEPVFEPMVVHEQEGIVNNVVFPTAVDIRGQRVDVFYGAADTCIGAANAIFTSRICLSPSAPDNTTG